MAKADFYDDWRKISKKDKKAALALIEAAHELKVLGYTNLSIDTVAILHKLLLRDKGTSSLGKAEFPEDFE